MPDMSANLALPYLQPAQAQKHVTHNEALQRLDILVQAVVRDRSLTAPPAAPEAGDCHIVAAGASGVWTGHANAVAAWNGSSWTLIAPRAGWRVHVLVENRALYWSGSAWTPLVPDPVQQQDWLGLNATADAVNRLAISAPATLLSHDGTGHQLKINKNAAADTASLLFQTGFSGRAEMGTAGNDDWSIKVSPDGATWHEALKVAGQSGLVSGTAVQSSASDATTGRLMPVGAFGLGGGLIEFLGNVDDLALPSGGYMVLSGATGTKPGGLPHGHMVVRRRGADGSNQVSQTWTYTPIPQTWHRTATNGVWTGWSRLYDQASILGTVSQSGGVPTGALTESGENANGHYRKYACGLYECWSARAAVGAGAATWTFPGGAFVEVPVVTGTPVATVMSAVCLDAAPSTTAATFSARNTTNARRADICHLRATGRWSTLT